MFNDKGQSLLELVVVIAVVVIVIGALTFATIASLRNAQFSQNQAQATKLAQEALEWTRSGRDRNECIRNLETAGVKSWNGYSTDENCPGAGSFWTYHILGDCENSLGKCYFNISSNGTLQNIGFQSKDFPGNFAEIPANNPIFQRALIITDDNNYTIQKTITAIVKWTDFSGSHESRLTTVLGRL